MMAERVVTHCEEDPTRVVDLENQDQKVPSSDEHFANLNPDDEVVPVKFPIKPMPDKYVQNPDVDAVKPVLQKVLVENILPKLHESKGGFLDESEIDKVKSGHSNSTKMHFVLEILRTKNNAALTTFCEVLEASHYIEAAEKLRMEIALRVHSKLLEDRPSEIELDTISEKVGGDYQRLLTHLGIPAATIKSFRLSNFGNVHSTCFEGLVFWREGNKPCRPATWSVLLDALEKGPGLKEYADRRRSELLSLTTACQTESLKNTHKVLREKNVALSLSPLEDAVKELDPALAEVLSEFRHHVTQLLPKSSMYNEVRSKCQTMIARKAGVSSFNKIDVPLKVSKFTECIIKKHTTFFDIELIHKVADILQQQTLTEAVARYEAILKPLMATNIAKLTDRCEEMQINLDSPEGAYRLVLKFPDDSNVMNLYKAKDYLEKVLRIPNAKLMAFDFGCILVYFEITCTANTTKDLLKRFIKHSSQLQAMGISGAFLIDHWAWDADSDDVWYTDDESDDMEVNDQQGFLGNRKRSHLGSVSGGCAEIVPFKKATHLKENCPSQEESGDRQGTAEEDCCSQPHHSPILCTEEREWEVEIALLKRVREELRVQLGITGQLEKPTIVGHPWNMLEEEEYSHSVQHKTPSDSGLYEVASQVQSAEGQHILAEKLGVTLRREQRDSLFNALKRWRDGGGGKDHPPTLRCLLDTLSQTPGVGPHVVRDLGEKAKNLTEFGLVLHTTPSDRGLYEVASQVQSAEGQRILAEKLGVTLSRLQPIPLFNALKRWRDGGDDEDHPPTWRCLLDALSQTPGVDHYVVRDLEEKATYLTKLSLYGDCREISSSGYRYQTNLRSLKLLKLSSSRKSSTQPVLRRLARKRRNRLKAISSSAHSLNCHHRKSQRTIRTSHTSHTPSLPYLTQSFLAQPQISSVQSDSTDEVGSTRMDQTDSGFSNDQ